MTLEWEGFGLGSDEAAPRIRYQYLDILVVEPLAPDATAAIEDIYAASIKTIAMQIRTFSVLLFLNSTGGS